MVNFRFIARREHCSFVSSDSRLPFSWSAFPIRCCSQPLYCAFLLRNIPSLTISGSLRWHCDIVAASIIIISSLVTFQFDLYLWLSTARGVPTTVGPVHYGYIDLWLLPKLSVVRLRFHWHFSFGFSDGLHLRMYVWCICEGRAGPGAWMNLLATCPGLTSGYYYFQKFIWSVLQACVTRKRTCVKGNLRGRSPGGGILFIAKQCHIVYSSSIYS